MTATITDQVIGAYFALTVPLRDAECMELLGQFGYTAAKLEQGMAVYEAVGNARHHQINTTGDYRQATTAAHVARTAAWAAYQRLATVARATVKPIDPLLVAHLGLDRAMPRGASDFLAAAAQLFEGISASPEIGVLLAEYGYTAPALAAQQQFITAYRTALHNQQTAMTAARRATRDHQLALQTLARWMTHYRQIALVAFADEPIYLDLVGTKPRGRRRGSRRRDAGDDANRQVRENEENGLNRHPEGTRAKEAKNEELKNEEAESVESVAEVVEGAEIVEDDQPKTSDQATPKPETRTGEDDPTPPIQQQE